MTALPALTPVTNPDDDTVATVAAFVVQVTVRPVSACPTELYGVAVSCTVWPTLTLGVAGVTTTLATGTGATVMVDAPDFPSMVAVIVTVPADTAVTTPAEFTVARALLLLVQATVRRYSGCPSASRGVAVNVVVFPTTTVAVAGETTTVATGTILTVNVAEACRLSMVTTTIPVPGDNAVTRPPLLTLVMPGVLVDQVTVRPLSERTWPLALRATAVSWSG
jgi:hypothetical protein